MRLLVLGGTAFLGREIVRQALAAGHDVTSVARGRSGAPPAGARFVALDRDQPLQNGRPGALEVLAEQGWDAAVDVSRQPGQVRAAAGALARHTKHFVFVSTGNVYADTASVGLTEEADLLAPLDGDVMTSMTVYGPAKVACEAAVTGAFGERATIARAGLIGGPGDASGRTGYWPWRFAHPSNPAGRVVVPDALADAAQIIDVRDLAAWLVRCATDRIGGTFNATGDTLTLGSVLQSATALTPGATAVPLPVPFLAAQGVQEWMGPSSLPLWISDPAWGGFSARSNAKAVAAGLTLRPLADTFADVLVEEESRPVDHVRGAGLTDAEEVALLAAWDLERSTPSG